MRRYVLLRVVSDDWRAALMANSMLSQGIEPFSIVRLRTENFAVYGKTGEVDEASLAGIEQAVFDAFEAQVLEMRKARYPLGVPDAG